MQLKLGFAMLTGGSYAIATAFMSTIVVTSSPATPLNLTENQTSLQRDEFLLAGDNRHQRHVELEQQMRNEMSKPHNRHLFQSQKENIIRRAHEALEQRLDQEQELQDLLNNFPPFPNFSNCTGLNCSFPSQNFSQPDIFSPSFPNCNGLNCPFPSQDFTQPNSPFPSQNFTRPNSPFSWF